MTTIAEIRAQYPQYADMPDAALADALHKKFYADMPRAQFDTKIGLTSQDKIVPPKSVLQNAADAYVDYYRGVSKGVGDIAFGAQQLVGQGLQALGGEQAGKFLIEDAKERKARETANLAPYKEQSPIATSVGSFVGEVAPTLPIGGVLGSLAAKIPFVANLAPAIASWGFKTGTPYETAVAIQKAAKLTGQTIPPDVAAQITKLAATGYIAAKVAGGVITGGTAAALVNPDEKLTGVGIGAAAPVVLPPVLAAGAKTAGFLKDAFTGQWAKVNAAKVAQQLAGADLPAVKAALNAAVASGDKATAAQILEGLSNSQIQALGVMSKDVNLGSRTSRVLDKQEEDAVNALARMAGGANIAESAATRAASKNTLGEITTPMRETELAAAGMADKIAPGLETTATRFGGAAANKVEDVRRFTSAADRANEWAKTWRASGTGGEAGLVRTPTQYTYPGELAGRAEQVATQAAENSLRFGEVARDAASRAASLEAEGFKRLDVSAFTNRLSGLLKDPDVRMNPTLRQAVTNLGKMVDDWATNVGPVTPEALYAIRKNGISGVIEQLMPGAPSSAQKRLTQDVLTKVRPLIDDAIETAGGTKWRNYLKTFEQGMHGIEQKEMADVARNLYKSNKQEFIDLIRGNNPDKVEKIFGPGRIDFMVEIGGKTSPMGLEFNRIASLAEREISMAAQAKTGAKGAVEAISESTKGIGRFPAFFSKTITFTNKTLAVLETKLHKKTYENLMEGMETAKNAQELFNRLPASQKSDLLRALGSTSGWENTLGASAVNMLAPKSQNALAP